MAKIGRPYAFIDKEKFEELCANQCTEEEIGFKFDGISPDTINRWCKRTYGKTFAEVFAIKRKNGCISLRSCQFRLAEKSPAMAIWLGKQYLGQREEYWNNSDMDFNISIDYGEGNED
jgi:hypothetical protein